MRFDEFLKAIGTIEKAIANGPIVPDVGPEEIRSHLESRYDFSHALPLDDVTADVQHMLHAWQVQITHPKYLGLFNPSVTPASLAGDVLTAAYNPQLATWRTSPAANEIERHTLAWLGRRFGFPADSAANFTSGGAEANLTAVVVALTRAFPEYGDLGIRALPAPPAIYLSSEAHHSFGKIAHMTGLGRGAVRVVAVDRNLAMSVNDLSRIISEDRRRGLAPFMVIGTAGTTSAGAIDPLQEIASFCRSESLWFHADAAWGGAAILSPRLRGFLAGIELADSITCDAHKWFSVPMGAGMFFCRHAETVRQTFRAETSYMPSAMPGLTVDPYTTTVQWSRRFIGLKLFLSLAHYGEPGYIEMIEHQTEMGRLLRKSLERAGWHIVNETPLPVVCFTREGLDTKSFLRKVYERQIAWISETRLAGGPAILRACITSYKTTAEDVDHITRALSEIA